MTALIPSIQAMGVHEDATREFAELGDDVTLARVVRAMRKHCVVWCEAGEHRVRVPKRVFRAPRGAPVVGDWVAVDRLTDAEDDGRLVAVLARRSTLSRRAAGRALSEQVVVANVDTAFVMVGLDSDFNLRRIERYLAVAWQGDVTPVVLLNKADLHDAPSQAAAEVEAIASGAAVIVIAAKRGEGLDALRSHLAPARTIVILGSSGVGKSTLVNQLLGTEHMATADVRKRDERGRHTTTHRELVVLQGGALLIDTPGMRELGLFEHAEGIAEAFADVEELAAACKFANCSHEGESGCAIAAALEGGTLDPERLASYFKLSAEVDVAKARRDKERGQAEDRAHARFKRKKRFR